MFRGIDGVDCTPAGTTGQQTVTMPSAVPAGSIGVALRAKNAHATNAYDAGAGSVGGTIRSYDVGPTAQTYLCAALNGSKQCDLFRDNSNISYQVVGYYYGTGTFVGISAQTEYTPTTGSWQTMDVSAETLEGATAACFLCTNTSLASAYAVGVRPVGSALPAKGLSGDSAYTDGTVIWCKLNGSRQLQGYRTNSSNHLYLIAYCTDGTWNTTPESDDKMPVTEGSYQDVTISAMARGGGVALYAQASSSLGMGFGARKNGSSWDSYAVLGGALHFGAVAPTDASKILEIKYSTLGTWYLYVMGYWDDLPPTPASLTPTYNSDNQEALAWPSVSPGPDNLRLEYQLDDGSWTFVTSPATADVAYNHTHSAGGDHKLKWKLRSENEYGNSAWTESAAEYTTPDAPTIGTVVVNADDDIDVPVTNNAAYASTHKFEKSKDGGAYSEFVEQAGTTANYTGGVADAKYNFRARTKTPNGRLSAYSSASADKWTSLPAPVVTTAGQSRTEVQITWTTSATATSYKLEADDGGGYSVVANPASTPYDRDSLTVRTSAEYKVTAIRSGDSAETASTPATGKTFSWVDGFFEDTLGTRYSGVEIEVRRRDTNEIIGTGTTGTDPLGFFDITCDDQWPYTVDVVAPEGVPASGVNGGVKAGVTA